MEALVHVALWSPAAKVTLKSSLMRMWVAGYGAAGLWNASRIQRWVVSFGREDSVVAMDLFRVHKSAASEQVKSCSRQTYEVPPHGRN